MEIKPVHLIILCLLNNVESIFSEGEGGFYRPLIIIPGLGGSRLYFQSLFEPEPQLVWVEVYYLARLNLMTEYMLLRYNRTTHTSSNPFGYEYAWQGFGDTYMIEHLSEIPLIWYTDYYQMIKKILRTEYYKRNITLRAAPYDFRKAPNESTLFFWKLRLLIEETYYNTGRRRVVLLGHSLGCMYSISFLNKMTLKWKKTYIKAFICVSGPLAGAVKDIILQTSGNSFIHENPLSFRKFERTFPSSVFLLPREKYFGNQILLQTPTKKYTAQNYRDLFRDINNTDGYFIHEDVKNLVDGSKAPSGIDDIYCFHGSGIETVDMISLKSFNDTKPVFTYGPGDGTVNQISLQLCREWKNVHYDIFNGANHKSILHDDNFLKRLMKILVSSHL